MTTEGITRPPHFGSEKEEAEWWDNNPEFILQEFKTGKG